jgi:hypothetical protein
MATIQDLMNSIAQMEGYNTPGTIAQRNNNPGNLRSAPTEIGSESTVNGSYATFASAADGWAALQTYIQGKMDSGVTLRQFINTYALPTENDTTNYLNYLVGQVGISADASLSSLGGSSDTSSSTDGGISDAVGGVGTDISGSILVVVAGMAAAYVISKVMG